MAHRLRLSRAHRQRHRLPPSFPRSIRALSLTSHLTWVNLGACKEGRMDGRTDEVGSRHTHSRAMQCLLSLSVLRSHRQSTPLHFSFVSLSPPSMFSQEELFKVKVRRRRPAFCLPSLPPSLSVSPREPEPSWARGRGR